MLKLPFVSTRALVATALAIAATVFSTASVLAAPVQVPNSVSNDLGQISSQQSRDLRTEMTIYANDKLHSAEFTKSSQHSEIQQYLAKYASALKQAEAISSQHISTNRLSINKAPQDRLAMLLHLMRGLQEKIDSL